MSNEQLGREGVLHYGPGVSLDTPELSLHRRGSANNGREIGATVTLLSEGIELPSWQDRVLVEKITSLIRGRRGRRCEVWIASPNLHFVARGVHFLRDVALNDSMILRHAIDRNKLKQGNFTKTISGYIDHQLAKLPQVKDRDLEMEPDSDTLYIYVSEAKQILLHKLITKRLETGMAGVHLLKDFSLARSPFDADFYRRLGVNICETADGYGEIYFL
jgi:hypothetical protein